ncbi:MAG: PfkB family carbohydrate kinase [Oscillibacter sp.]|nr:PfkB family carbohydrate kinase [Oscillibacter sp.]
MSCQIVGVGHCCYDFLCTVEQYPPEDGSTHILQIEHQGGGAAGTALVASSRLGIPSGIIASWGDDETGRLIREGFEDENVCVTGAEIVPGGQSCVSYVMVHPENGTRTKFPCRDVLPPLHWSEAQKELLRGADVLHLDGTRYENALRAAQLARSYGVTVSLDGCTVQPDNEKNLALVGLTDILIMNARYPFRVAGTDDTEKALRYFAALGPRVVITTGGSQGCTALIDGKLCRFPAYSVQTVDTTGAGDVFHGAFLAAWLRKMDLPDCIRYASAASALKCTKMGGRAGIPTHEAVLAFLQSRV